jgi:hypothetical protein
VLARDLVLTDRLPATPAWLADAEVDLDGPTARVALTKDR